MVLTRGGPQSPRSKAGAKWLSKIRKGQVAPKGLHLSNNPLILKINFSFLKYKKFYRDFISVYQSFMCEEIISTQQLCLKVYKKKYLYCSD